MVPFDDKIESDLQNADLSNPVVPVSFGEPRHTEEIEGDILDRDRESWRMKDRMKTVSVALVLCLHVGVDPPDVIKPNPCARLECWVDANSMAQTKALETIGYSLQKQYERWQPRARYKQSLDPTVEDVRKLCTSLRRNAKEERVLFHYNGHGVPKPTENGEIWVFNKNFTQYIPLSVYDLQTWMGSPSVYVYDCNCAGLILRSFTRFADDHLNEFQTAMRYSQSSSQTTDIASEGGGVSESTKPPNFKDCIQLAACQKDELLPMCPEVPADLFTSCLTTPIKTAVLWYITKNNLSERFPKDIVDKIPGQLNDRRSLLGELNWIFTAITDTIAWNTLPTATFQKLFRQDLLVASLFRNFLLADRIMRSYNCTPESHPKLELTHEHRLWESWDYACDLCLTQLQVRGNTKSNNEAEQNQAQASTSGHVITGLANQANGAGPTAQLDYTHSPFFANQLTAFEVWLLYGRDDRPPPEQLPVVLQVLLSQVHRVRALELLGRFLDLGSWAVTLALSVGIFPYVLKLLQSSAKELRPLLSFIWAKILSVDPGCQADLVKEKGHLYFLQILNDQTASCRQKIVPAFILASIADNFQMGQEALMEAKYVSICVDVLVESTSPLLRLWLILGLGRLWTNFRDAHWQAVRSSAHDVILEYLKNDDSVQRSLREPVPEVRAAAVYALGTFASNRAAGNEHATQVHTQNSMLLAQACVDDGSVLVRKELVVALHWMVLDFESQFVTLTLNLRKEKEGEALGESSRTNLLSSPSSMELTRKNSSSHSDLSRLAAPFDIQRSMSTQKFHHLSESPKKSILSPIRPSLTAVWDDNKNKGSAPKTDPDSPGLRPSESLSLIAGLKLPNRTRKSSEINDVTRKSSQQPPVDKEMRSFADWEEKLRNISKTSLGMGGNAYSSVWVALYRLATDPCKDVSVLARKVVSHVHQKADEMERRNREKEKLLNGMSKSVYGRRSIEKDGLGKENVPTTSRTRKHSDSQSSYDSDDSKSRSRGSSVTLPTPPRVLPGEPRPMFTVGSPAGGGTLPSESPPVRQQDSFTTPDKDRSGSITRVPPPVVTSAYSFVFNPKRRGTGPKVSGTENGILESEEREPLVRTEFVPWCAKKFSQPVLSLVKQCSIVNCWDVAPLDQNNWNTAELSDWAAYAVESIEWVSDKEKERLFSEENCRLDSQKFFHSNPTKPVALVFSALKNILAVADETGAVVLWDWQSARQVDGFVNRQEAGHGAGSAPEGREEICWMEAVNPLTHGYLATGTKNGVVRVWNVRNFVEIEEELSENSENGDHSFASSYSHVQRSLKRSKLVTCWRILNSADTNKAAAGRTPTPPNCVYFWDQHAGCLLVGSGTGSIRVWDAAHEQCSLDISSRDHRRHNQGITSISADMTGHKLVVAGFEDGTVKLYDRRLRDTESLVTTLRTERTDSRHKFKVHLQPACVDGRARVVASATETGEIKIWEPRMFQEPVAKPSVKDDEMILDLDVHARGELIACSTPAPSIRLFDLNGKSRGKIKYQDGLIGHSIGDVQCMKFHPYRMSLATGCYNHLVSVYGMNC